MEEKDYKLPLGLCKQASMKLEAFIHDVMEIKEDPDLEPADRQDFETMGEMAMTMLACLINIVNKECEEHEFISLQVEMDQIDSYPEDEPSDMMDDPIE